MTNQEKLEAVRRFKELNIPSLVGLLEKLREMGDLDRADLCRGVLIGRYIEAPREDLENWADFVVLGEVSGSQSALLNGGGPRESSWALRRARQLVASDRAHYAAVFLQERGKPGPEADDDDRIDWHTALMEVGEALRKGGQDDCSI